MLDPQDAYERKGTTICFNMSWDQLGTTPPQRKVKIAVVGTASKYLRRRRRRSARVLDRSEMRWVDAGILAVEGSW